jgi:type IV pilus assembly protein PilV
MFRPAPARAVRGVSLIEVLVAIVIFSLGLLGLALMEMKGATFTKEASSRTMAILQARSLADRMQANPNGVAEKAYAWTQKGIPTGCDSKSDVPAQVACNDLVEWLNQVQAAAPASGSTSSGYGTVEESADNDGSWIITVSWNGSVNVGGTTDVSEKVVFYPSGIGAGS